VQRFLVQLTRFWLRLTVRPLLQNTKFSFATQRRLFALYGKALPSPRGVEVSELVAGSRRVWRIAPPGKREPETTPAILFVHGGGFVVGGLDTHRGLASRIALASGADVYLVDYRLAPEHPAPDPSDDVFAAWQLIVDRGHDPACTAIAGDSAGGTLAITTARAIREMGGARPAAMALISPVTDLSASGSSIAANERRDVMLKPAWLRAGCREHAGPLSLTDPEISPLFGDLSKLPPTLVQVAEWEVLLDDSVRFADRAWAAGVEVELQRFPGLWHDFQVTAGILRIADEAIADIGAFLRRRWES
jgi:monoterpene epsilon-lactone hydrolase